MLLELIAGGLIVGQYVYHRLTEKDPPDPSDRIEVAKASEGVPVPLLFGRVRVRKLLVAWYAGAEAANSGSSPTGQTFKIRMLFVAGIPVFDSTIRLHGIYVGDRPLDGIPTPFVTNLGGALFPVNSGGWSNSPEWFEAEAEFGDGVSTQDMSTSNAAGFMNVYSSVSDDDIPGMRGYVTLFLDIFRFSPRLPVIEPEVSTYPATDYWTSVLPFKVGEEMNPAHAVAAVLCDPFGKLGLDTAILHQGSFNSAAATLLSEGHGYSRAWEDGRSEAKEIINDIERQTDGVVFKDEDTGLWHYKLIRPDYDPSSLLHVSPSNCRGLDGIAVGGWTSTINKIRVVFEDRADGYRENSATAHNQANAVGQDGETNERVMSFPGVKTMALAQAIAGRELAAQSRPLLKCRAIVDRTFWYTKPGDVVKLSWPEYSLSNRVMRVGRVSRGAATDNHVVLDLIEDFFYVHRGAVLPGIGDDVAPFPDEGGLLE